VVVTNAVGSTTPFHSTTEPAGNVAVEPFGNPVPPIVSEKAGPPAVADAGLRPLIVGAGPLVITRGRVTLATPPLESVTVKVGL
jgi:hypothetical protein